MAFALARAAPAVAASACFATSEYLRRERLSVKAPVQRMRAHGVGQHPDSPEVCLDVAVLQLVRPQRARLVHARHIQHEGGILAIPCVPLELVP